MKRFYKNTNILLSNGKYEISLDQRKLKTPSGRILEISSKPLAYAIAAEWDSQVEIIQRSNMHLTALCNSVLDNPNNHSKTDMVNYIVHCLETDTTLFQSNESEELYKLQCLYWDPLIQWFCNRYQVDLVKTQSINTPNISLSTKQTLIKHLVSYNYSSVHGILCGVDALKSVILTLATIDRKINVEEAVKLSRLEEEFQTSHWGIVEWSHNLNKEDLQARLSAAILFTYFNIFSITSRPKNSNCIG
ncbi:ATP synthase mitochondrial F1 complex assembly factor 2 isoform X2 [Prorops nasuta]